jgi:Zn-dependent protease
MNIQPNTDIRNIVAGFIILLACVSLRMWFKAWMIDRLGDPNPRAEGRLTLNPQAHFDPIGTGVFPAIFILFWGAPVYGWGRYLFPRTEYFRKPVSGEIIVALSGSVCNIAVGTVAALIGGIAIGFARELMPLFVMILSQNAILAVFNLLPIPPLDGAFILKRTLHMSEAQFARFAQWSLLLFLALIFIRPLQLIIAVPYFLLMAFFTNLMQLASMII